MDVAKRNVVVTAPAPKREADAYLAALFGAMIAAGVIICAAYNIYFAVVGPVTKWIFERNLGLAFTSLAQPCRAIQFPIEIQGLGDVSASDDSARARNKDLRRLAHMILIPWGASTLLAGAVLAAFFAREHLVSVAVSAVMAVLVFLVIDVLLFLLFGMLFVVDVPKTLGAVADTLDQDAACKAVRAGIEGRLAEMQKRGGGA